MGYTDKRTSVTFVYNLKKLIITKQFQLVNMKFDFKTFTLFEFMQKKSISKQNNEFIYTLVAENV